MTDQERLVEIDPETVERIAQAMFETGVGDWTWADVVREEPNRAELWREDARNVLRASGLLERMQAVEAERDHAMANAAVTFSEATDLRIAELEAELAARDAVIEKIAAYPYDPPYTYGLPIWLQKVLSTAPPSVLADHDRRIKAEAAATALEEAAEAWGDTTWEGVWAEDGVDDDVSAVQSTVKWLKSRAAELREVPNAE